MANTKIFLVQPILPEGAEKQKPRLIRAERRAQVESFLIGEMSIEPATQEECIQHGAAGIQVEDAKVA